MKRKNLFIFCLLLCFTIALAIGTGLILKQNRILKEQFQNQKKRIEQQSSTTEAIRKSGLMCSMNRLLTKVEAELKQSSKGELSSQTITQLATLSESFELEPYNHFELDNLLKKQPSFERGQLFMALVQLNMDSISFRKIKSSVSFEGANLEEVDLSGVNLSNAKFYCANFKASILNRSSFKNADLRGANFSYSNLNQADLQETNLNRANLHWAEMNDALLINSDLGGINLSNAKLKKANLSGIQMSGADLRGAVFKEATMIGAIIKDTDLSRANLTKANLTNADFRRANLSETTLNEAIMVNVELTRAGIFIKNWLEMLPTWKIKGAKEIQEKYQIADKAPGKANYELGAK